MLRRNGLALWLGLGVAGLAAAGRPGSPGAAASTESVALTPATMPRVGTIDERYQSYNVEMLEVTGGRFWKPYSSATTPQLSTTVTAPPTGAGPTPAGMNPDLYQYRPPVDLANPRLRKLAAALGPAYVRVSGTWANTTWLADVEPAPKSPPAGFDGVLT